MATDDQLAGVKARLQAKLSGFNAQLVEAADAIDIGAVALDELIARLSEIPGARSVAADLVSKAMFKGLGDTFDKAADQVDATAGGGGGGGWIYTAVMDGATCDECEAWDGTTFDTWEEIAGPDGPLPDGGPHPDCYGGDRCRCRPTVA